MHLSDVDTDDETLIYLIVTADEWHAIRYAALMLADVTGNAPLMPSAGVTRSDAMKGRRRAFRLRDEVARISTELGLGDL